MRQLKVGDKVHFRQDGEIGTLNQSMGFNLYVDYTVTGLSYRGEHNLYNLSCGEHLRLLFIPEIQLEPAPEPQPKFANIKKGDWVEHLNGTHLLITAMEEPVNIKSPHIKDRTMKFKCNNRNTYSAFDGSCIQDEDKIVRILPPKEVIVDFGSGIRGTIRKVSDYICVYDKCEELVACIYLSLLEPKTRAMVEQLIKAQEEE